jgi:hypothetical protein
LNFGVRVSGSGPGIVGLFMVPSAVFELAPDNVSET